MSPDSIPQLSLGTAALIIFLICAAFVMLRGMTRMLIGTAVLALSAWLAFTVWQKAPDLSIDWTGKSIPWITTGLPIAAFISSYFIIRLIAKSVARPFGKSENEEEKTGFSLPRLAFRLLFALVPTTLICLIGAALIHHAGSIAEIRAFTEESIGTEQSTFAQYSQKLKSSLQAALPDSWLMALDPLADPTRLALAKAITAGSTLEPAIDPTTGQAIPRAIIVEDPELQTLAREGKFGTLLRHPLLTKALDDPKVQSLLKDLDL